MWVFRAFIFSLSIALLAAVSSPVSATTQLTHLSKHTIYSANLCPCEHNGSVCVNVDLSSMDLVPILLADHVIIAQHVLLNGQHSDHDSSVKDFPTKTPVYQSRFNPNLSLPPFERQAASAFGISVQNEPIFVLSHEFLPEILGLKHFLAPLKSNNAVPWYLRPDATTSHGRLAGWKDGNSLYTGTITYLS